MSEEKKDIRLVVHSVKVSAGGGFLAQRPTANEVKENKR